MMKNYIHFLLICWLATGCVEVLNSDSAVETESLVPVAPDHFNYATTQDIRVALATRDNGGKPLARVPLTYGYTNDTGFHALGTLQTNAAGEAFVTGEIPAYLDSISIRTDYLGLPQETKAAVRPGVNHVQIGGVATTASVPGKPTGASNGRTHSGKFSFLAAFDAQGVPNNLEAQNTYIPQDLLDLVNNSLPERRPVPQFNPEYIDERINSDTRFRETADVWITFVHEGAGWRNALGYYTYDLDAPPTSVDQIKIHNIIFPNVSLSGSGGNLRSGNRIYLGRFPANTGIGWFLVPDGWNGSNVVDKGQIKYSDKNLNTFTAAAHRPHVAALKDDIRELVLLGIEDTSRPGGDNDFNDAVFFVTANPYRAVITDNVASAKAATGRDSDGDNVLDRNDLYPNDANRAFHVFSPAENVFGSLAFEDMWPQKGDYDMNDLVVDYNFKAVTNVANEVIELEGDWRIRALGASHRNGLAIELPVAPEYIASVELDKIRSGSIALSPNGTEAGQERAVVVLFDNSHELFGRPGMVNTLPRSESVPPVQITFRIKFSKPVKLIDLGDAPFNPFIFVNDRSVEVHLPGMPPTSKANAALLGKQADSSRPAEGRFYKSGDNMPWAIHLPEKFDYPLESRAIDKAHLRFSEWAKSGGTRDKDWFRNKGANRLPELIFR